MANPNIAEAGKNTQWQPGESGNPAGKPKGAKSLATIVSELESDDFDWKLVPIRDKDRAKKMGAPWRAIVYVAIAKAFSGDMKAAEWLRKSGYGDKLDVTSMGKRIQQEPIIMPVIKPRVQNAELEAETTDGT